MAIRVLFALVVVLVTVSGCNKPVDAPAGGNTTSSAAETSATE